MIRVVWGLAFGGALIASTAASASDGTTAVFERTCLASSSDFSQLTTSIEGEAGWSAADPSDVDIAVLGQTQSVPGFQVAFKKPSIVSHWVNSDGVHLVLARYDKKVPEFRDVCVVAVEGVDNFFPFREPFEKAVRAHQPLKGKNTDAPHLYQMGGKTKAGRFAKAELFTRSAILNKPKTMIMYIAVR